jgi:hypothetical protein
LDADESCKEEVREAKTQGEEMKNDLREEFAKALVQIRDRAVQGADIILANSRIGKRTATATRWQEAADSESYAEVVIADSVDTALFTLLDAIDNGVLKLRFVSSSGKELDLSESQEMAGDFITDMDDGWRSRFAKERVRPTAKKKAKRKAKKR